MRDVKEHFHLTNSYIAKESDVSIKTIERIMALNYDQDIMRSTTRSIELAVIGQVGDYTCYLDNSETTTNRLLAEIESLRKEKERLEKIIDRYMA